MEFRRRGLVTRLLLIAALLTLVGIASTVLTLMLSDGASATSQPPVVVDPELVAPGVPHQVTMRVGDTMVVEEAGLGCQVDLRGERVVIECRRAGQVAGTYMTLISKRGAKLARFRSADAAKVIVTAAHGGGWRACTKAARIARAGGRACR
jgi:hypothetical protein